LVLIRRHSDSEAGRNSASAAAAVASPPSIGLPTNSNVTSINAWLTMDEFLTALQQISNLCFSQHTDFEAVDPGAFQKLLKQVWISRMRISFFRFLDAHPFELSFHGCPVDLNRCQCPPNHPSCFTNSKPSKITYMYGSNLEFHNSNSPVEFEPSR
jgi:hypothetical protein